MHNPGVAFRSITARLQYVAVPLALIGLWEALYQLHVIHGYLSTAPSLILAQLRGLIVPSPDYGTLTSHIASSMSIVFAGLALAVVIGIPVGLAMAANSVVRRALTPLLYVVRPLPPIALLPLAVVLLGLGNTARIALVCAASWPTLAFTTFQSARTTDAVLLDAGRSLGASRLQLLTTVVIPASLPGILTGFRVGASLAFMTIVAAELLGATQGLGYLLSLGARNFDIALICATLVVIAAIGLAIDRVLWALQRRFSSWENVDAHL